MSLAVFHMLDELFLEAERSGMLLAPSDRATRMALSRRMRRGDVVRPFRNMYAPASMWDALPWQERTSRIIHTYAALYPSCVFCSYTAAFILGLQVPKYRVTGGLHILSGKGVAGHGVVHHAIPHCPVEYRGQLAVTSRERTAYDCMARAGFRRGLAVADSLLRLTGRDRGDVLDCLERSYAGFRGISRVRQSMAHADARSENGGESYARAVMIEYGVQLPDLQVEIPRPDDPHRPFRLDYYWELANGKRIGGELDGLDKTEDESMRGGRSRAEVLFEERTRGSLITAMGIQVVRFTFKMAQQTYPLLERLDLYGIPRRGR